jgi:hypothetical protein
MAQDSLVFAHDSWHPQLGASSVGHCSGDGPLSPYAPPERDGGQEVIDGGSAAMFDLKPPWDVSGQMSCSCDVLSPLPALLDVASSSRCPCGVHPRSRPKVRFSFKGLVTRAYSVSTGNAQVASHCSSRFRMEVVKFVKTKPLEIASLELPPFRVVRGSHRWKVWPAAKCLGGTFYPNFKSRCKSSRRLEWCPFLERRCARCLPIHLGSSLSHVDWSKCHE